MNMDIERALPGWWWRALRDRWSGKSARRQAEHGRRITREEWRQHDRAFPAHITGGGVSDTLPAEPAYLRRRREAAK